MRRFFLLLALAAYLPGCAGYHLGPIKPSHYKNVVSIAIPPFTNKTLEPRVEVLIANTLIKQFQQDGTYKIADEKDADAILECSLELIDRRPARSVIGNVLLAKEYTLTLRCRYKFYRRGSGEILEARSINGQTSFFVSGSSALEADVNEDERQAIPLAAEDMAVRLVAQLSEGW